MSKFFNFTDNSKLFFFFFVSVFFLKQYARHGCNNVIALVGNDACWTQIEREQTPMFGKSTATMLAYRDYDQIAKGYGGEGILVKTPGVDFQNVFQKARNYNKQGKPVLINVHIGKSDFREGSISV